MRLGILELHKQLGSEEAVLYLSQIEVQLVCNGVGVRNRRLLRDQLHWPRLGKEIFSFRNIGQ